MSGKSFFYFTAGLNLEHARLFAEIKEHIGERLGSQPSHLTIMLELMKAYQDRKR